MTRPNLPTSDELAARCPPPSAGLTELQEWMAQLLRHKRGLQKNEALKEAAARHFSGNDRLSPAEQVNIYRQQFWLRHTNILIDDFPGLSRLLGQKEWERVAESYLTEVGYGYFALRDLGRGLAAHLSTMSDLKQPELLIDMARLEWAYEDAFDAPDDPSLSGEKLAQMPPEAWQQARIQLSHSIHLLELRYPVARLRRDLKREGFKLDREQPVEEEKRNLVVYRRDGTLWDKAVSRTAFLLLTEFQKGTALIPACEAVVALEPQAEAVLDDELMSWFSLWGRLGWITDVHPG